MARSHIISAIFLSLISANMIHGGIIPGLFHEDVVSEFPGIPIRELSHNFVTSAANAASSAFNGFRNYIDYFRTRFGQRINIPPEYPILHRVIHGDIWPNVARLAPNVPGSSRLIPPRPIGNNNYKGIGDGIGAASAGAASSAASGRLAKYSRT
ncbi:PREDICTED: uncharacterized protein LOC108768442 [Trachymyrmex cornetzi]|uniref:uncharacterized protein LOC108768442 n=1 Tax=Trachymyrmex cornetzi TaxID=471704 RepID=UPI00084F259F|nr:PREDICTED: uncharacterized protein LOC108768442 [Trachymyrmex cornetzi]XP_018374355.1 PREDICTED: uncharacterized protein LOC108768442 [Trachymyrmex cornetzi]